MGKDEGHKMFLRVLTFEQVRCTVRVNEISKVETGLHVCKYGRKVVG